MKSLNIIVNRKIKEIEDYEKTNPCKEPKLFEASMTITYSQLKEIKKDLEVLEIIKKKYVDIPLISLLRRDAYSRYDYENKVNEYILEKYNERLYLIPMCLTLEELIKIRKWMEGDENEIKKSN